MKFALMTKAVVAAAFLSLSYDAVFADPIRAVGRADCSQLCWFHQPTEVGIDYSCSMKLQTQKEADFWKQGFKTIGGPRTNLTMDLVSLDSDSSAPKCPAITWQSFDAVRQLQSTPVTGVVHSGENCSLSGNIAPGESVVFSCTHGSSTQATVFPK
jgi:hypothetical protein